MFHVVRWLRFTTRVCHLPFSPNYILNFTRDDDGDPVEEKEEDKGSQRVKTTSLVVIMVAVD